VSRKFGCSRECDPSSAAGASATMAGASDPWCIKIALQQIATGLQCAKSTETVDLVTSKGESSRFDSRAGISMVMVRSVRTTTSLHPQTNLIALLAEKKS
jgi:hypothetical protein